MSRYSTTKQIKNKAGKRQAATTILPVPTSTPSDSFIQVTSAERLDTLAYKFYGDAQLWWILAVVNGLGKGTLYVPENTRLRIPATTELSDLIEQTNNSR